MATIAWMRDRGATARAVVPLVLAVSSLGCARGCGGAQEASTSPSASIGPSSGSGGARAASPAVAGSPCNPGPDSVACTPDGLEVLACAGASWRVLETCRGPAHCRGAGSSLSCDPGDPQPGDACVSARATPRCPDPGHLLACTGGRWAATPCGPGKQCGPAPQGPRDASGPAGEVVGRVGCN